MLNLSQIAKESSNYPVLRKIQNFKDPDVYLAENLADYHENAKLLEFPWYKRFPPSSKFRDRAYIVFQNVGLKKLVNGEMEIPNWFVLHDNSGLELVYWNADHELFPTLASFDEVQAEQGLKEDDWVYDVFVRYLIPNNLSSIVEVNRYRFSTKKPEKDFLAKRVRSFFPEFEPELQPAF